MNDKYVSSSVKRIKKRLKQAQAPEEKDEVRVKQIKDILDTGLALYQAEMKRGNIKRFDWAGFEKMFKMSMTMMDRPSEIIENRDNVEEIEETQFEEITASPEFMALKDQIAAMMNAQNEEGKRK